jgi:hypothetical protein
VVGVRTTHDVLVVLVERYAFGELAALVADEASAGRLTTFDVAQVQQLCAFGQRLLDLDAEDFGFPDATAGALTDVSVADSVTGDAVPRPLVRRARACRMPQSLREQPRGALGTLVPAYRLLLEVIAVRWTRRETAAALAAIHLASEYLPFLAWEPVLGHAGDPRQLAPFVSVPGSRFGGPGDRDRECAHNGADRAGARRLRRLDDNGWRTYLNRQHSNVAHALGVCAAECPRQCGLMRQVPTVAAATLGERCRLAMAFADSPLVRLRHAAPVGHGFAVPSLDEVADAWQRSRRGLGPAAQHADGFCLPGLPGLFASVATVPLGPDTLLADTAHGITAALAGAAGRG